VVSPDGPFPTASSRTGQAAFTASGSPDLELSLPWPLIPNRFAASTARSRTSP